jgi:hypothetical protein
MAIVLAIVGVSLYVMIGLVLPAERYARLHSTNLNMKKIILVMAAYAQHNNRIPCPADPNTADLSQPAGSEVGSGAGGAAVPDVLGGGACRNGAIMFNEGIVPYATLGIAKSDVIDGWGNFITYHVSPAFAVDPSPAAATVANAHALCRMPGKWIMGEASSSTGPFNRNGSKARFCCPDNALIGSDITIQDASGASIWASTRDKIAADYAAVDTPTTLFSKAPPAMNVEAIVFVLVSHGANGKGAFLPKGTRIPTDASTGTAEIENQNGDNIFVYAPLSDAKGPAHFDDIVMWQTQDDLYSALGHLSCQIP